MAAVQSLHEGRFCRSRKTAAIAQLFLLV